MTREVQALSADLPERRRISAYPRPMVGGAHSLYAQYTD